jgi:hypothetical protein
VSSDACIFGTVDGLSLITPKRLGCSQPPNRGGDRIKVCKLVATHRYVGLPDTAHEAIRDPVCAGRAPVKGTATSARFLASHDRITTGRATGRWLIDAVSPQRVLSTRRVHRSRRTIQMVLSAGIQVNNRLSLRRCRDAANPANDFYMAAETGAFECFIDRCF